MKAYDIFISYARGDNKWVDMFEPVLRRISHEIGVSYFIDSKSINPGGLWESEVYSALSNSSLIICFISKKFYASTFV